jgi:hypothetical protein
MTMSDWSKAKTGKAEACHYRCGFPAPLTEPGRPWKAHKVCADKHETGEDQTSRVVPWDGNDDRKPVEDRALGCGVPTADPSVKVCAGTGTQLSCQLCPASPNYWDREGMTR